MRSKLILLGVLTVAVSACGTGRTMILEPASQRLALQNARLREGRHTVDIPDKERARIREIFTEELQKIRGIPEGGDLTIEYRLIQFKRGSQFTRWFWGGIGNAGEGSLTVEATFFGPAGHKLARIQAEGRIGSGAFGGAFSSAIHKAAKEIINYASEHLLDVPKPQREHS